MTKRMNKAIVREFEPFGIAIDLAFLEGRESTEVVCTTPQSFCSSSPVGHSVIVLFSGAQNEVYYVPMAR